MEHPIGWLDVEEIGERLAATFPQRDPYSVRFTELRAMVEQLPGFEPDPEHPVNEKILETIQSEWIDAKQDLEDEE